MATKAKNPKAGDMVLGGKKTKKTKKGSLFPYDRKQARIEQLAKLCHDEQERLSDLVVEPTPEYLAELEKATEIGFDVETLGLEHPSCAFYPDKGELRLLQAYLPSIDKCIIWDLGEPQKRLTPPGLDILKKKLISPKCTVFIHNAAFENAWINSKWHCPIFNVVDSLILSQLYWAGLIRGFAKIGIKDPNSLKQVAFRLFGEEIDKTEQSFDYALPLLNNQLNYAAYDGKLTYRCGKRLLEMCWTMGLHHDKPNRPSVVTAEMAVIPAFAQLNYNGYPVDVTRFNELYEQYTKAESEAIAPWMTRFPKSNPGSWQQVLKCFDELGIVDEEGNKFTSTGNELLTPVQEKYPLVKALLLWRTLKKQREYLDGYMKAIEKVRGFDVIRSKFKQNADQVTGRSSSSKPNLQNVPKLSPTLKRMGLGAIRSAFKPPEGYKIILEDLSASHAQLARQLSQDPALLESNETGLKIHFYTVSGMMKFKGINITPADCAKARKDKTHPYHKEVDELYDPAKTTFYSGLNLGGAERLKGTFADFDPPIFLPLSLCKEYTEGFKVAYPQLVRYQRSVINRTNQGRFRFPIEIDGEIKYVGVFQGYYGIARSFDGGLQYIEKMPSRYSDDWQVKAADAVSFGWLRPEATIIKYSMALIVKWLLMTGKDAWLCGMAHDEVNIIAHESIALEVATYVKETITKVFQMFVSDYIPEEPDPAKSIINNWSEK